MALNLPEALQRAFAAHQAGNLAEAERICKLVIRAIPSQFDALHLLGVLEAERGHNDEAYRLISRALNVNPRSAEALNNRANVLSNLKRYDEALASCDKALAIKPRFAEALNNRGNVLHDLKRYDEALASYDEALAIRPDYVKALGNRANVLQDLGRYDDALASCDRALAIKPDFAEALNNRGNALHELKRYDEALACYDKALAIKPDYVKALSNRGNVLHALKRHDEALVSCERALAIKPDSVEALNNRGNVLWALKRYEEALASCSKALAIEPDHVDALCSCGNALHRLNRYDEAISCYRRALAIKPDYAQAHYNLGRILTGLRRLDEAIANFRRAHQLKPDLPYAFSSVVDQLRMICDWSGSAEMEQEVLERVRKATSVEMPFLLLTIPSRAVDQLRCAQGCLMNEFPTPPPPLPQQTKRRSPRRDRKIRIAYVSANFHSHPVAQLMAELFERHDRATFEVIGFSFGPDDRSGMRRRLEKAFDRFVDVRPHRDAEIARRMHELEVDVAIDLMGHTEDCRLGVFAHRPAPVQATYLGYAGTTGADFIDYIIVDPFVVPADQQPFFAEKLVHLPDCYMVNGSKRPITDRTPSRAECGLPEHGFVFCCFNNAYKITPTWFDIWMRLLTAVPGSVLWLRRHNEGAEINLRREAEARGVDSARLVFAPRVTAAEHLARHRRADLFLDTLPYNAHATASDALWAGLPVLTCAGSTFAGRVGGSLLQAIGLPELVAYTAADYEHLALKLAREPRLLQEIHAKLRRNRLTKPLFDTDRFRRHIEAAYLEMLEIAGRGQGPRAFTIAPEPDDANVSGAGDRLRG